MSYQGSMLVRERGRWNLGEGRWGCSEVFFFFFKNGETHREQSVDFCEGRRGRNENEIYLDPMDFRAVFVQRN